MARLIMKAAPEVDLYMEWSSIAEGPTFIGNRRAIGSYLLRETTRTVAEERLGRADKTGTSQRPELGYTSPDPLPGSWEDDGLIVDQRGFLPRARFEQFMRAYQVHDEVAAYELLDPFTEAAR